MIQAHSYTPAIVYVEAGEAITKHMAVCMTVGGKIYPATPLLGPVLGIALTNADEGDFLTVQTDGVLYNYEGSATPLYPGCWYQSTYIPPGGMVVGSDTGYTIGIAITDKTLQLRFTGQGTGTVEPPKVDFIDGGDMGDFIEGWDEWDSIDGGDMGDLVSEDEDTPLKLPGYMTSDDGSSGAFVASDTIDSDITKIGSFMTMDEDGLVSSTTTGSSSGLSVITSSLAVWDGLPSIGLSGSLSIWSSTFED